MPTPTPLPKPTPPTPAKPTQAPEAAPPQPQRTAPPPQTSPNPSQNPSQNPSSSWRDSIAAWIDKHQTYPEAARRAGTEGTTTLRFTLNESGAVSELTLQTSSGSDRLDRASLDLLRGATLPKPGANDPAPASFIVPLRYRLTP